MGRKLFSNLLIAFSAFAASFSTMSTADAADAKVYPGASCMGFTFLNSLIVHDGAGSVSNINFDNPNPAFCPIVTDSVNNPRGLSQVRVHLWEPSDPSTTSQCTVWSFTPSGVAFSSTSRMASNTAGSQALSLPLPTSPLDARYLLICSLSPAATLFEYEIEEVVP